MQLIPIIPIIPIIKYPIMRMILQGFISPHCGGDFFLWGDAPIIFMVGGLPPKTKEKIIMGGESHIYWVILCTFYV